MLTLVGNGQLRLASVGLADRAASDIEIGRMRGLLRQGLSEGAVGYSIGLEYPSEVGCGERELVELARETARAGGFYATHTRNRAEGAVAAVEEAIRTARDAEVRLQVSHLMPRSGDAICEQCVEVVDAARGARARHFLRHAYAPLRHDHAEHASATVGVQRRHRRRAPESVGRRIARANQIVHGLIASLRDWDKVQLLDLPGRPDVSRLTLGEIGRRRGRDPPTVRSTSCSTKRRRSIARW